MGCAGQACQACSGAGPGPAVCSSRRARGWALLRGVLKGAGVAWRRTRGLWVGPTSWAGAVGLLWDVPRCSGALVPFIVLSPVAGALSSRGVC